MSPVAAFDGVTLPRLIVELATGGTTTVDPASGYFVLGTDHLDTGVLGGVAWADITADTRSISIPPAQAGQLDSASPRTMTLVVDNASGVYDPTVVNLASANQADLESGTTAGWGALYNCTIGVSPVAQHGAWSMTLTSAAGGDMGARTPTGKAGIPVRGGLAYTTIASFQTAAQARTVRCHADWYDAGGSYISTSVDDVTPADATSGWAQAQTTDQAPLTAAYAALVVEALGTGAANEVHRVDAIGLMQGAVTSWAPGGTIGVLDVGIPVKVSAEWAGTVYGLYRGFVDDIVPDLGFEPTVTIACTDGLETLGRAFLPAASPSFDADAPATRIGRYLDAARWASSLRALDTGITVLGTTTLGDFALPLLQAVVDSELGLHFVDGDGRYTFFDRLHAYTAARSTAVQATLSDVGTDVDMVTVTVAKSRSTVFNEARVTRSGGTEQVASDAASQATYGLRTYPGQAGTELRLDADAASLASWLVGRFKTPVTRVSEVRVDAIAQGMWAALLGLRRLDRIRVLRDYGPVTLDIQLLVQDLGTEITDAPSWQYTFATRNSDVFSPFILGTSKLNTGALA